VHTTKNNFLLSDVQVKNTKARKKAVSTKNVLHAYLILLLPYPTITLLYLL